MSDTNLASGKPLAPPLELQRHAVGERSREHIVHLSYTLARPACYDPEAWLARVAFVNGVAEQMTRYGKQTVIYNIHYRGEITRNGVRYLFPAFTRWQLILPFSYNRYIKKLNPDVVLVHGLIFPWQIIMLRWIVGRPVKIICQHHAERPYKDFRKFIFRKADKEIAAYLFASKAQGDEWVRARQISSATKVHEVMGTSSIFHPIEKEKKPGKVYLWIGDLNHNKDPILAVNAFKRFAARYHDVRLYLIYQGTELLQELKLIVRTDTPIEFVGRVDHAKLQDWFNKADFIMSTSHYEGSGIAVCEALSCGCIPVLTDIPSFRMMTENGSIGRLFKPGDEDGLVKALEETYNIDHSGESKKVISFFRKELSFEANAQKIRQVIDNIRP
jgi:glycosyltransferase involved in cell wall biosynthesis